MAARQHQSIVSPEWGDYLKKIYFDPAQPGSFQSPRKLQQTVRQAGQHPHLGTQRIGRWLQNQTPYSRNRAFLPKSIKRSRVIVRGLYDQYDADLADYQRLAASNDGYRFLLVVIDIFSRYTWVVPIKSKKNAEVIQAFEIIFREEGGHIPRRLRTDQGGEFTAHIMNDFFNHYKITHFVAKNEVKANYAERVIKTLKSKLSRYMAHNQTGRYIDVLADIVTSYNATYHKSIQTPPKEVTKDNESSLWWMQYRPRQPFSDHHPPEYKFKIQDHVRIPHVPSVFGREWSMRWTEEIFVIVQRFRRDNINLYKIEDEKGEDILGTFYEGELQLVLADQNQQWKVQHIVKERGVGVYREAFVKFIGWPAYYNRWIPYADAQKDLDTQDV